MFNTFPKKNYKNPFRGWLDYITFNIYEQYEKNLNILITEANQYRYFLKQSLSINVNLFDEWAIDAKSRYNDKYLKMDILLNDFEELLTSVKLDINYSYDEKFVLWTVKNNFSVY